MRVALVTGIYPPDIGGPATHSADLRAELLRRGHRVVVVTLHDGRSRIVGSEFIRFPRRWPWPARFAAAVGWLGTNGRRFDVVYATGLHPEAVVGARLAGKPVVLKIVGDPVWERARRLRATSLGFEPFQKAPGGSLRVSAMRMLRDWSIRRASALTAPSDYLARTVEGWLGGPADVQVIPNGVRLPEPPLRVCSGPLRAIYVGRLVAHKRVDALIRAVGDADDVHLEVVGGGPELQRLTKQAVDLGLADRVDFTGELPHDAALRRIVQADVLVIASDYEGLPHVVIVALGCGTPVLSVSVGGVGEILSDRVSGLMVPSANDMPAALEELKASPSLRAELSAGARRESRRWRIENTVDGIERLLDEAKLERPRVVYFGRTRLLAPPRPPDVLRKLEILQRHTRPILLDTGVGFPRSIGRTLVIPLPAPPLLGGAIHYGAGAILATALAAGRSRGAVVCQSPYEGFGVVLLSRLIPKRLRPSVVVEVHGDWGTATRSYGSRARRLLPPIADRAAGWTLRRADRVRVVSGWLEELVRAGGVSAHIDRFPAYTDLATFEAAPAADPPAQPVACYIGALERVKGVDVLLDAWPRVMDRIPEARLVIAGDGRLRSVLEARVVELGLGESVNLLGALSRAEVRATIDDASCVVVPSRSEGFGRVVVEAMLRGRPVVASAVGGILEWVQDGVTGRLVPPDHPDALAMAVSDVLADPVGSRSMGSTARRRAETACRADSFSAGIERMAEWVRSR